MNSLKMASGVLECARFTPHGEWDVAYTELEDILKKLPL